MESTFLMFSYVMVTRTSNYLQTPHKDKKDKSKTDSTLESSEVV